MTSKSLIATVGGAVAGLLVGAFLVGKAVAQQPYQQQPTAMPRYQYKCITKAPEKVWTPEAVNMLNAEGGQGWRLMENRFIFPNGYSDVYCFERRY